MEISQAEMLAAIERAQEALSVAASAAALTGYVFGYVGAMHWTAEQSGKTEGVTTDPPSFPTVLRVTAHVDLPWPDGTRVRDDGGAIYTRQEGQWKWTQYADGETRDTYGEDDSIWLSQYLPAYVLFS